MMICATYSDASRQIRSLSARYHRQFQSGSLERSRRLAGVFALSFRPGDRTSTFAGKLLRPLGAAAAISLFYEDEGERPILSGVRGELHADGFVDYGADGRRDFQYDLGPEPDRCSRRLSIPRNPSLAELLLRMDVLADRLADEVVRERPLLPRVLLGFAPQQLPPFEVTPALVTAAAHRIGVSPQTLATNCPLIREKLFEQEWESLWIAPEQVSNPTGLMLIDAEFCTQAAGCLRAFEDFSRLVGVDTWNPVRGITPHQVENPTPRLLAAHAIDPCQGWEAAVDGKQAERLLAELRLALGEQAIGFSEEDLCDALVEPLEPVTAVSELLPRMRKRLSDYWSECSTDADLRQAARRPASPLHASGACHIQVRRRDPARPPVFTSVHLKRRANADWRPIVWPTRSTSVDHRADEAVMDPGSLAMAV